MAHNGLKRHNKGMLIIYYDMKPPDKKIKNLERIKIKYELQKIIDDKNKILNNKELITS